MEKEFKIKDLVTIRIGEHLTASNVFEIGGFLTDGRVLLSHPLAPEVFIVRNANELDVVGVQTKNRIERLIMFAHRYENLLDFDYKADLEAVILYFMKNRQLSGKQKKLISNICGNIAAVRLDNDIDSAISLVNKNKNILDSFNSMWYDKLKNIFEGSEQVTIFKQRVSVFNIAGYVMSELET